MPKTLWSIAFAVAILASPGFAVAEDQKSELPVPRMNEPVKTDANDKQEPSATKSPGTDANAAPFANGMLTAPGAPTDVDTAPSKFSPRSAADDRLPTAAYCLKHLSAAQKSSIYAELGNRAISTLPGKATDLRQAVVGAEIPADIALAGLQPLPQDVTTKLPELTGVAFTTLGSKLVLVDSTMRIVIDVSAQ